MTLVDPAVSINRTSAVHESRPETIFVSPPRLFWFEPARTSSAFHDHIVVDNWIEFARSAVTGKVSDRGARPQTPEIVSPGLLLRSVRESAGLTWEQIARVFGVSRRAVHHWAAGENMSAHNIEMLARLERMVGKLPGQTAEQKRAALFAADEFGVAPIDAFRTMAASSSVLVKPRIASHSALLDAE